MSLRFSTALQMLHRPHLITPSAAMEIAQRIRAVDPRAFRRPAGPFALIRKKLARAADVAFNALRADAYDMGEVRVMEDDDDYVAPTRPGAYAPVWMGEPDVQLDWGWSVKDGVAMMEISGPLAERGGYVCYEWVHGYDTIAAAIAEADANGAVHAMLIRFDTPGGVVASGLDDLSAMLQARGPDAKPIWAHCEMACSAGYWIASQCDNVLAPRAGMVGSIGAVIVHEDYSEALAKNGIKVTSIEFPEGGQKTEGAPWKALSDDGLADLQAMIDHCGEAFLATVAVGRGAKLTAEKARSLKARVFTADHSDKSLSALSLGLIDGVMSEKAAFDALKAEVGIGAPAIRPAASARRQPAARAASKPATPGTSMETDMMRAAMLAVLAGETSAKTADQKLTALTKLAAGRHAAVEAILAGKPGARTSDEKLADIRKILDEEEEQEAADEGDKPADEQDEEEEPAEAPAATAPATASAKPDAETVLAILDLPEAQGRDRQARVLAETPGMTVATAKGILAAGPKERPASRLAGAVDPKLTSSSAPALTEDEKLLVAGFAAAGIPMRQR